MTTKPKARKFRIRRTRPVSADEAKRAAAPISQGAPTPRPDKAGSGGPGGDEAFLPPRDDGFGDKPFPGSAAAEARSPSPSKPAPASASTEDVQAALEAIATEGLTGRQLRMARRLAAKHGLTPQSDFDAVRLLRAKGIDPFERSSLLELVVPEQKKADGSGGAAPSPSGSGQTLPTRIDPVNTPAPAGPPPDIASLRAAEISAMQTDIARRRRRKLLSLAGRLSAFVFLPTILAGIYYTFVATPMYATQSEFVIQQADAPQTGMAGLFSGTGFATSQDSITVQSYLQSRDAMLRLDNDHGFIDHFSGDDVDILQRLEPDASNEDAYKVYKKRVSIGYDPTEGIIRMEVAAASPEKSREFSEALIAYAEEQVDNLTQRLREDQMAGAIASFEDSEAKMVAAQQQVLRLQEQLGVLDPASETTGLMSQITQFEVQLAEKRLQLEQLLDNTQPNQARVSGVRGDIDRLEALIADLRAQMTESNAGAGSLASISGQLSMAQVDLETRTLMMQEALQQLESARIEANRQVRYLSLGVSPVPPDEPTYPKPFENTLLAFLIFAGVYLMVSLTMSILREQVSS
ncbi:MAG: capsule biosynthesis protein [Paracoccaceae bacterium]|nr:capsule biosynthesis protein [Paracoccaceae bacterium]